LTVEGY
jgi:hypothetical protein